MEPIQDLAKRWLSLDQDKHTRKEVEDLLRAKDDAELEQRLRHRISFGTAGLRAPMKAGFAYVCMMSIILSRKHWDIVLVEKSAYGHHRVLWK
jgi:phosphoglucomutase